MKIATNALVTIFVIGLLALSVPAVSAVSPNSTTNNRNDKKLERVTRHHDRKLELRAGVLGMTADQLREELRTATFDQVLKKHGFKDRQSFHTALLGKVKDELKHRGWSDKKIAGYLQKRADRFNKHV